MVRRLKADLRRLGAEFPERKIEKIWLAGLPEDTPELDLWRRLAAYGELRRKRLATLPAQKAVLAKLGFIGLQQATPFVRARFPTDAQSASEIAHAIGRGREAARRSGRGPCFRQRQRRGRNRGPRARR
jgi:hypothetical protein